MNTPHLLDAVCSIENAETFLDAADLADEIPSPVAALVSLRLRQLRATLDFHIRRPPHAH